MVGVAAYAAVACRISLQLVHEIGSLGGFPYWMIHLREPVLILVVLRETLEIFEEDRDPVAPSVEGVFSPLKSRKGEELSLHFERSVRDSFRVFRDDGKSNSPKERSSGLRLCPLARPTRWACRVSTVTRSSCCGESACRRNWILWILMMMMMMSFICSCRNKI